MASFLENMTTLFAFIIAQLGAIANFFITTTLGQVVIGLSLFAVIFYFIYHAIKR